MKSRLSLIALLFMLLMGCGRSEQTAVSPTSTIDPVLILQAAIQATIAANEAQQGERIAQWQTELTDAEALWQEAAIDDYTITVTYFNSTKGVFQIHTLRVENGEIVADSVACSQQNLNCIFERIDLTAVTVPGLFGTAHAALNSGQISPNSSGFNFDPETGVPEIVPLQSGNAASYWRVDAFETIGE